LVIILGFFLILNQISTKRDIEDRALASESELGRLQRRLSSRQQPNEDLQAQINALRAEINASEQALQVLTAVNIDWYAALAPLFDAQPSGVVFESVTAGPEGVVSLGGVANQPGLMASLPTQLSLISDTLDFQGILWSSGAEIPSFTATFLVRQ